MKRIVLISEFLASAFIILAVNADVSIQTNLMTCQNRGSTVGLCEVQAGTFVQTQSYDSKLTLTYDFICKGSALDTITLVNERNEQIRILQGMVGGTSILTGTGPFKIEDLDPGKTKRGRFEIGCSFILNSADIRPSETTINTWSNEKVSNQVNIVKSAISRDGFSALSNYHSAFILLENINNSMASDLSMNFDLRNSLDKGSTQRKLLEDLIFNSVDIKDPITGVITHTISRDEKLMISKLLDIVDHLPAIADCQNTSTNSCIKVTLDSYLSEDQKKALVSLTGYKNIVDKAKEYETEFANDNVKYINQQIELCKISKMWINWDFSEIPSGC